MLGLFLDAGLLLGIFSIFARQNLSSEFFRFFITAALLSLVYFLVAFTAPPAIALLVYLAAVLLAMKYIVGATWLGSALGSVVYIGAKIGIGLLLGLLISK